MEIFEDGAFPNLEYHLIQVIRCVLKRGKRGSLKPGNTLMFH